MSIEELLQETLHDRATHVADDDDLGPQVIRRARGRRGRRVTVGMSAVVLVVIVVVLTITATLQRTTRIAPDPRATAVPSVSPKTPAASIPGLVTTYQVAQGLPPSAGVASGAPISVTPRLEVRGATTYLVTPTAAVALPATVNGARSIQPAGPNWVVFTVSSDYTGGDSDTAARILVVSPSGVVRALVTDDVRSIAVSPDGAQVASVETVETRTVWSVTLVVRRIADGAVLRKVPLPYGSRGEWPYEALSWTTDGIVASNQSGSITVAGATVLVRDKTVTDEAPITGIYRVPLSTDGYVTSASGGSTCLSFSASSTTPATSEGILCGRVGSITVLSSGLALVLFTDTDGSQAVVADPVSRMVTVLTLPPEVYNAALIGAVADGARTVLVPDYTTKTWWRWDVVSNTVETAPLPSGAKAAISW